MKIQCVDNIQRCGQDKRAEKMIAGFIKCVEACKSDTVDKVVLLGNVSETKTGIMVDIMFSGIDEYAFNLASTNMQDKVVFALTYKESGMVGTVATLPDSFVINKIQRVIKELEI